MSKPDVVDRRVCQICGADRAADLGRRVLARTAVAEVILPATGSWSEKDWICGAGLHHSRHEYVKSLLEAERGALGALDYEVLESLRQHEGRG